MTNPLFGRSLSLIIGVPPPGTPDLATLNRVLLNGAYGTKAVGYDFSGQDIAFEISKTLKAEPNKATFKIYNLAPTSISMLANSGPLVVKFDVGYQGQTSTVYQGTVRSAWTNQIDDKSFETTIETGDSELNFQTARISYNQGPKSPTIPIELALEALVTQLGVGDGNLQSAVPAFKSSGLKQVNSSGLHGNVAQRLTDLCRSIGFSWSVQNGAIQILPIAGALNSALAVVLDSDHGMIGSPTVDSKGYLSGQCLIQPGVLPGSIVQVNAKFAKGAYKVQTTKHHGSTFSKDEWYIDFTGTKYAA